MRPFFSLVLCCVAFVTSACEQGGLGTPGTNRAGTPTGDPAGEQLPARFPLLNAVPPHSEEILVTEHDAVCDGATDDTDSIQAANDAAYALAMSSGIRTAVRYPTNQTCVLGQIQVRADQLGRDTTLLLAPGANSGMFNIDVEDVRIAGFMFDGNREHQETVPFTNNYNGISRTSLIQAHRLFRNAVIEDNVFRNTMQGAIGIVDQTANCFVQTCQAAEELPGDAWIMDSLVVRRNTFEDIRTTALHVRNPYAAASTSSEDVLLNGRLVFQGNHTFRVGTIEPETSDTPGHHGNATLMSGFREVLIADNRMEETVRVAFKFGGVNDLDVVRNQIIDAHWAGIQLQTFPLGLPAHRLRGSVTMAHNQFSSRHAPSHFAVLIGSSQEAPNHNIHPFVHIHHNTVTHTGENPARGDAIVQFAAGKYEQVHVEHNSFLNLGRAAYGFVQTNKDDFQTAHVVLAHNFMRGGIATWANGLFFSQGIGRRIKRLEIVDNVAVGVVTPIDAEASPADELFIRNNAFRESRGAWNLYSGDASPLDTFVVEHNVFDGPVSRFVANEWVWQGNQCPGGCPN